MYLHHTIYAIHAPDADKLASVEKEMRKLGAPTIEVVECGDHYRALEGSHRIAAAHALGLAPRLIIRGEDDVIDVTKYDWYEPANWGGAHYPAGEVVGEIHHSLSTVPYMFEDDIRS